MHKRLFIVAAIPAFLFSACAVLFPWGKHEDFIRVSGTHFVHDGKPYYFGGTNYWHGCYLGSPGSTGDRPRLLRELDSLNALGMTNLRLLAASEESYIKRSVKPAIQRAPGVYDDSLLQGLDFVLAAMADRKMHAVLYLNNYWEWSGGMAQYNVWAGGDTVHPPEPENGFGPFMEFSATFYANTKANLLFRNFLRSIITRRNTVNGRRYDEDPTIMSWQLANEPRPGTNGPEGEANLAALNRWVDETAGFIHALDSNHLVSAGSEGAVGFRWSSEYFLRQHDSKNIDYLTFHLWPKNWGWFDPDRFEETLPASENNALAYIGTHLALARQLHKPITMEEFGLARDSACCAPGSPVTARDRYLRLILGAVYDSARAGAPFAGWNIWTWGGEGHAMHPDDMWRPGDPFIGDPPQEPQGYNSVFLADRSTLDVIRGAAYAMMGLGMVDTLAVAAR